MGDMGEQALDAMMGRETNPNIPVCDLGVPLWELEPAFPDS